MNCETSSYFAYPSWVGEGSNLVKLCEVINTHIVPIDSSNSYGQLKQASLTVQARLTKCEWDIPMNENGFIPLRLPDVPLLQDGAEACFNSIVDLDIPQEQVLVMFVSANVGSTTAKLWF
jgi:hypothetical protein